jgi:hypothetical protein
LPLLEWMTGLLAFERKLPTSSRLTECWQMASLLCATPYPSINAQR